MTTADDPKATASLAPNSPPSDETTQRTPAQELLRVPQAASPVQPQAQAPQGKWKAIVGYLKDAKDVLAGVAAISAAILFAINYFATAHALNCFKIESNRNYEMIQNALQVNTITASLENANLSLSRSEAKLRSATPGSSEHESILKDIAKDKVLSRRYETELSAALARKNVLDQKPPSCE